ncbi:glycosyltransferase involved in cell wall biosynthesis [Sphaerotilus hippei]|uniref:Glycosyltransferase involved in cell wall biosynthesis n=1 Tax=Sphaerotilus hippei TaxID=744406 RepID=A0A318H1Q3_9BURK|nr:glycosyltransferase family 4 protein [Sphaerotilus hippei]PXW97065.1 glycosyltransferase involved in cell wall biosynthesis [Sphaerotilus hippei]
MNKRILFINLYFEMGGVETLLLRLIRELQAKGFYSTVLLLRKAYDPVLLAQLQQHATVFFLSDIATPMPSRMRNRLGGDFDYIFVTINYALILGALLQQFVYRSAHLLAGVYQTELFCAPVTAGFRHHQAIRDIFRDGLPDRNKVFGNDAAKAHHELLLGRAFPDAPVVPLMIDIDKYCSPSRARLDRHKIVSIGRLCDFKTYNFTMLEVVKSLRERGYPVTYHIYGDGPDEARLRTAIAEQGLSEVVVLHGPLEYAHFQDAVSDALVFIGSGTAVMEAAACGVPSIAAIEYSTEAETYGFIHEIPGTSFFEPHLPYPRQSISDLIAKLLAYTPDQYRQIEVASIQRVQPFSPKNVVDVTAKALLESSPRRVNGLRYAVSMLVWRFLSKKLGV